MTGIVSIFREKKRKEKTRKDKKRKEIIHTSAVSLAMITYVLHMLDNEILQFFGVGKWAWCNGKGGRGV